MRSLTNHYQVLRIHLVEIMLFRLKALVWFVVGCVNTVILLLFWWAVIQANGQTTFSIPAMTTYYVLMFTFATATICHQDEDISRLDIYKGNLYGYLVKPYSYLQRKFYEEVVWRLMGGFWAVVVLIGLTAIGLPLAISSNPTFWLLTILSAILAMLISFYFKVSLGLLSIWMTNINGLADLLEIISVVLGGFVLPIHFMTSPLKEISLFSPFAATMYYPVHILTAEPSPYLLGQLFASQLFWLVVMMIVSKKILKKGLKDYAGMGQ